MIAAVTGFPVEDVLASRSDATLQQGHTAEVAETRVAHSSSIACRACGASGDDLAWFYFSSPPWTWERLCGRAGVIAYCDRDQAQVAAFISMVN